MFSMCLNSSNGSCSRSKKSCPICRQDIEINQLVRVYLNVSQASAGTVDSMERERQLDNTIMRLQLKSKELNYLKVEHKQAEDKFVSYKKALKARFEFFTSQFRKIQVLEEEVGKCKAELSETNWFHSWRSWAEWRNWISRSNQYAMCNS